MGAATTSCEDMFTPENDHVTTDLTPQDTVYQVMGIVGQMQKLVDQTILLGEVRSDLVSVASTADKDLQNLAIPAKIGTENKYNDPSAYYSVINSCNVYLAYVDSTLKVNGVRTFEKEVIAVKTYRAWAYLELVKLYKNVPLILEPILSSNAAEDAVSSSTNLSDMIKICDTFIADLEKEVADEAYRNDALRPSYNGKYNDVSLAQCFIPLRVMLGELYLWRGSFTQNKDDFKKAAGYYQSFLAFENEEKLVSATSANSWRNGSSDANISFDTSNKIVSNALLSSTSYSNLFSMSSSELLTLIPMDIQAYYGTYSNLASMFCSQFENNYYAPVNPSKRILEISQAQTYCTYYVNSATKEKASYYAPKTPAHYQNQNQYIGDLRYSSNVSLGILTNLDNDNYSKDYQYITKYGGAPVNGQSLGRDTDERVKHVTLFRTNIIYLHMAEALSRAGFPETAFAVLKYGMANDVLTTDSIVPKSEYTRLQEIVVPGAVHDFTYWGINDNTFISLNRQVFNTNNSYPSSSSANLQRGIHDFGSGDSYANAYYAIRCDSVNGEYKWENMKDSIQKVWNKEYPKNKKPYQNDVENWTVYMDSVAKFQADSTTMADKVIANNDLWYAQVLPQRQESVDSLILEEMALEGVFEGYRYYDLMRYAKYVNNPAFMGERIAERTGKDTPDPALKAWYAVEDNWYLELPKR